MKRGRPRTRWRDESEEDLNIVEIKNRPAVVRGTEELRETLLEANVHNYCSAGGGGGEER